MHPIQNTFCDHVSVRTSSALQPGAAGSSSRCGRQGCTYCNRGSQSEVGRRIASCLRSRVRAVVAHRREWDCRSLWRTYLSNFSIRSTWVMIMRRQQYRLRPSWSIASLSEDAVSFVFAEILHHHSNKLTHPGCSGQSAPGNAPTDHQSPVLLSVFVACRRVGEPAYLAT